MALQNGGGMRKKSLILLFFSVLMLLWVPASADSYRENPSLYSTAEIVQKLPKLWMANPIEVMELMKNYPDFACWRGGGTIGCKSNNNKNCAEIFLSLDFSSDDDYAEFDHLSFNMQVNNTEEIQKVIELFWLDGLEASNIYGAKYPSDQVTFIFSAEDTLMTYGIPFSETGVWILRVDIGFVRG